MERIWQKNYDGKPTEVEYRGTVVDMFDEAVERWGDKPAFHCLHVNLRYSEVAALSRDFAAYLQKLGVGKGDRVAVMMPNLLSYPVISFGIIRLGAVLVSVNPLYTPRELVHQLADSGAETVVIFNGATPALAGALPQTNVKNIVTLGLFDLCDLQGPNPPVAPAVAERSVTLPQALLAGRDLPFEAPQIAPEDLLFLQYTGGTTGVSKGAMLSHSNLVSNIAMFEWVAKGHMRPGEEVVMTALPLYHIFALMVNFLCYFKHGALNVLIPNPRDMPGFAAEWSKFRVTTVTGVNTLFIGLMNTPGFENCDFSGFRIAFAGGTAVQKAVSERWKALTGVSICEGYGLSETSPVITTNILGRERFGTTGIPTPSTDFSIRDDAGHEVGVGETGEICVKGPQVMSGYWGREDDRAEVFTEDGFFRTGDIGVFDKDGFLQVVDRKKDMILVSGFNVYPNEVEDVLAHMEGLIESACVGVPDEKSGEAVKVVCVRKDPAVTKEDVIAHCRENLTGYKVPHHVVFVDELPKSPVGKILRRELREEVNAPRAMKAAGAGATLALACVGAAAAWAANLPLGLLIGPMALLTVCAQRFPALHVPKHLYGAALIVIGLALGQNFTPEIVSEWGRMGGALALNTALSLAAAAAGFVVLRRVFRFDPATAIFAGLPGGILTVMEVSRESDADAGAVMFFQVFRIILGATLIPLGFGLAGYDVPIGAPAPGGSAQTPGAADLLLLVGGGVAAAVLGRRVRFPSAEISAPLLWSAVLHASGAVGATIPVWMPAAGFVIVGAAIGTLLPRPGPHRLFQLAAQTFALFCVFMALTFLASALARPLLGIPFPAGVLTFSPASLTEMIAVALALDMEPALVAANNMFRMILCSILAPFILIWLRRHSIVA